MKTIDVMEGDTWTLVDDGGLFQYRNKQWRGVYADTHESEMYWRADDGRLVCELDIPSAHARGMLIAWGYKITAAKPEAKPEPLTFMEDLVERTEKAETVKPELTVPLVDVVWVEVWGEYVYAYTSIEVATKVWQRYLDNGKARIVRIRSDDEKARFLANHANERLDQHVNRLAEAHARIDALESRLAAEKPADKDAARVVKAPKNYAPPGFSVWRNYKDRDDHWVSCLGNQGITVEKSK